ncbi:MAG: hypothetical protein LBN07_02690 [Christensenellaceae bacterium]|nr:hypothetical protein [Christensenellaceae bacterium]
MLYNVIINKITNAQEGGYRAEMFFVNGLGGFTYVVNNEQYRSFKCLPFEDLRDHLTNNNTIKDGEVIYKLMKYFRADPENELIVGFDNVNECD